MPHLDAAKIPMKVGDKVVCATTAGIWEVARLRHDEDNVCTIRKIVKGVVRTREVYTFHCNINNHPRMIAGYEADAAI